MTDTPRPLVDDIDHQQAIQMALTYAACRAMGHSWKHDQKPVGPEHPRPIGAFGSAGMRSVCVNCKGTRVKWITRSGSYHPPTYDMPKGYALHGDDRLTTQQWRRQLVIKFFDDETQDLGRPA